MLNNFMLRLHVVMLTLFETNPDQERIRNTFTPYRYSNHSFAKHAKKRKCDYVLCLNAFHALHAVVAHQK